MNSQLNNQKENQEQVFSEDQFRTVFFDSSKRGTNQEASSHIKRARLDSAAAMGLANREQSPKASTHPSAHQPASHHVKLSTVTAVANVAVVAATTASSSPPSESPEDHFHHHHHHAHAHAHAHTHTHHHHHANSNTAFVATCCNEKNVNLDDMGSHNSPSAPSPEFIPLSSNSTAASQLSSVDSSSSSSTPTGQALINKSQPAKRKNSMKSSNLKCKIRKFRSRSLPNILFSSKSFDEFYYKLSKTSTSSKLIQSTPPPLPPVNIQSLKEIDLSEILKNPQLRHDILFDPQLQFRPNLDGERGRRKKITYDKYWDAVQKEIDCYFMKGEKFDEANSRLPTLFKTLRDILISLLPSKDKQSVIDVLDIELIMQQLHKNSLDFISLAKWLSEIFKSHCAPMRDSWVDEMISKFLEADKSQSINKLIEGLRMIFSILEAMKLDVANHQIRILRPVLVETAVEFERDYFVQMINRCKLDISDSIKWFKKNSETSLTLSSSPRSSCVSAILSLLSCSNMVSEFPSSLAFDHARLIVLRANVRQVVCLQLCSTLYRQLIISNKELSNREKSNLLNPESLEVLKKEILAIITDDNGNVKWTRNIAAIALQLSRRFLNSKDPMVLPPEATVEFAFSWLIKQTQPNSEVYSLMEKKIFNVIKSKIESIEVNNNNNNNNEEAVKLSNVKPITGNPSTSTLNNAITSNCIIGLSSLSKASNITPPNSNTPKEEEEEGINSIASRVALLAKFHWSVFGSYYLESIET